MSIGFGLTLVGVPDPISQGAWDDVVSRLGTRRPHAHVATLLQEAGPGSLCALFEIPDPRTGSWESLQLRFARHRDAGQWAGLPVADAERLVVFATDARGAALGCTEDRFWLLAHHGGAFEAGASLEHLVHTFLVPTIGRTYETRIDPRAPFRRADDGGPPFELDFGCEPVFVTAGTPGIGAYLDALRRGEDGDAYLERAMGSMPLLLSHRETLIGLLGPRGDGIDREARAEAIALVTRIATRREPSFTTILLPPTFDPKSALDDPKVRAWAESPPRLSAEGPFAKPEPEPVAAPIRLAHPMSLEPWFRSLDAASWVSAHAAALGETNSSLADELESRASSFDASRLTGYVRQIEQLDASVIRLTVAEDGGIGWEREPAVRADAAAARLRDRRADAWPLLALAVGGSKSLRLRGKAAWVLHGLEQPPLPRLFAHAIACARPPYPFGADPWSYAERLAASGPIDDNIVSACLPALEAGSGVAAMILSKRVDRDDVVRALLAALPSVICAQGWDGREPPHTTVPCLDVHAARALAGLAGVTSAPPLDEEQDGSGPEPRPQKLTGPWVTGAPGPITLALVGVGGKRVLDRLRAIARDKKLDIEARTEAARGLVYVNAPGVEAAVDEVEKAWVRYWKI